MVEILRGLLASLLAESMTFLQVVLFIRFIWGAALILRRSHYALYGAEWEGMRKLG